MKPLTYFRLALLFPYLLWCILAVLSSLLTSLEYTSTAWEYMLLPLMIYVLGVIFWVAPYTILAVGMWIWSRKKSTEALRKLALLAPVLLAVLMVIESTLMSLPYESMTELVTDILKQGLLWGGFSLLFGYLCVAAALGMFKFLQSKGFVVEEKPPLIPEV